MSSKMAERIGEDERFGELTSAHQKTSAVDGPWVFGIHSSELCFQSACSRREKFDSSGVTVRAEMGGVNYTLIVQRWNSGRRMVCGG